MSVDININENIDSILTNVYNTMVDINRVSQTFNQNISNTAGIQNINIHLGDIINSYEEINRQQVDFNQFVTEGEKKSSGLLDKIKSVGNKVSSITNSDNVFDLAVNYSDNIADINSSVAKINDGSQNNDDLQNKIYGASVRSRTDMGSTLSTVEGLSGAGFNNDEAIQYTENLNKMFAIAGVGQEAQVAASGEMVNALADGIVAGEELNSMMSATPEIVTAMAENMGMPVEGMAQLAEQGKLTADMLKNSMLGATGSIDAQFANTKTTWSQTVTNMTTMATMAFEPVGAKINDIINSPSFTAAINGIAQGFANIAPVIAFVLDGVSALGGFIVDNFSFIAPIIAFIIGLYALWAITVKGVAMAQSIATKTGQVFNAVSQGLKLIWATNPIVIIIMAVIAALYLVVAVINKVCGTSYSATGIIVGVIMTAIAVIWNGFLALADIILGIIGALINPFIKIANFIGNVFTSPISSIIYLFRDMAVNVLNIIKSIAGAIDKVFGTNLAGGVDSLIEGANSLADSMVQKFAPDENYEQVVKPFDATTESLGLNRKEYGASFDKGYELGEGLTDFSMPDTGGGLGSMAGGFTNGGLGGLSGFDADSYSGMLEGNGVDMATMGNISTSTQGAMSNTYAVSENTAGTNENSGQLVNIGNSILEIMRKNMENQMNKPAQNITFDMSGMNNNISSSVEGKTFIDALTNEIIGKMNAGAEGTY